LGAAGLFAAALRVEGLGEAGLLGGFIVAAELALGPWGAGCRGAVRTGPGELDVGAPEAGRGDVGWPIIT
jgi:hypothetical protein